jgi:uncharacterized protein (DUF1778 family)
MGRNNFARKQERLETRLSPEEKETIEMAAQIRGTTVTDFVVTSAKEAAIRAIRENEVLVLGEQSRKVFVDALLNPPRPNQKALSAAKRWKQELG